MDARSYNNPAFAQGLGSLMNSYYNPGRTASNNLQASQALLNNQTAQFRDAIGDTGLSGDLSSMMIRALQAGPQYSGNAPKIGRAALEMGAYGFGPEQLTPTGSIAAMMVPRGRGGGGGGRRSGGTTSPSPSAPKLTQGALNRVASSIKLIPELQDSDRSAVLDATIKRYNAGGFGSLDEAFSAVVQGGIGYEDVQVGVDQNDSWLNPLDWFEGPEPIIKPQLRIGQPQAAPTGLSAPDEAIQHLIANPGTAAQFDEIFGPGTAAAILGG